MFSAKALHRKIGCEGPLLESSNFALSFLVVYCNPLVPTQFTTIDSLSIDYIL